MFIFHEDEGIYKIFYDAAGHGLQCMFCEAIMDSRSMFLADQTFSALLRRVWAVRPLLWKKLFFPSRIAGSI
jgi:hypothetical protein